MSRYLTIGGITITSYGLLALMGMAVALLLACWNAPRMRLKRDDAVNAGLYALVLGVVGGKLLYLFTIAPLLAANWARLGRLPVEELYQLLGAGFVYYGGLIGAVAGVCAYAWQYRLPVWGLLDVFAPSMALFHSFGRIGCLLSGCCYGIPYDGFGAVQAAGTLRFPVQLAEAAFNLMIAVLLVWLLRSGAGGGRVLAAYLMAYGCTRFLLEYLRGDLERGFVLGLSTSQWLSLLAVAAGGILLFRGMRQIEYGKDIKTENSY